MQPQEPSISPGPNSPSPYPASAPTPDYSFLDQQPKKRRSFNLPTASLKGRVFVILGGVLVFVILLAIVKGLVTTSPLNQADYTVLLERQQEIEHILTVDVTIQTASQLTPPNQNFVATAAASIQTAQSKNLTLLADYKVKINTKNLAKFYDTSIDQEFTNSLQTNTFNSLFVSVMQQQIGSYQQELTTAYSGTSVASGRSLLKDEYSEAKLLLRALSSPTS